MDPLEKKSWGLRQFTVKDLDGNLFFLSTMTNQTPHNKRLESAGSPAQIRTLPIRLGY